MTMFSHSLELYYLEQSYNMTLLLHMTMSCHNMQLYLSVRSIVGLDVVLQPSLVMLKYHLGFSFDFLQLLLRM
jgi:hypothetical protein